MDAQSTLSVRGLRAPVEIKIDRWGVAHIHAKNTADLFFAQGYNAARDRLWQIDLWRKRGLGLLAADFGPGYLAQDRASRLFLYRGDMAAEWRAYGPDAREICESFVQGINAYIDGLSDAPDRLPPEFIALGSRPAKWKADDVVRIRTHGWMRNVLSEATRAELLGNDERMADHLRMNLEPPTEAHRAPGLDLKAMPASVLDAYRLAIAPVTFSDERLAAPLADADRWTRVTADDVLREALPTGSNNWAIHGSRTTTGRPILATDPHRAHALPSLRYLVHLSSPALNLMGAGEPNFPGIVIGHNGDAAFGLTLFLGPDQEDLYVYETQQNDPARYRYRGGWERMREMTETIDVRGHSPQPVTLRFTRHGAVVAERRNERQAFALRTIWSEPGAAPYGAALMAMRARTADNFERAMAQWIAPPVNQTYADRRGDIMWITGGRTPIRRNWDGLLPVPGDGRYEWDGFLKPSILPSTRNPSSGFVSSANALNLPAGWDYARHPMGAEWDDPSRLRRISEVLSEPRLLSVADSVALQTDVLSIPARRLQAVLRVTSLRDADAQQAAASIAAWDCRVIAESAAAAIYEVWWSRCLKPALFRSLVPNDRARSLIGAGDVESVLQAVEQLDRASASALLDNSLAEAMRICRMSMGDVGTWSWGRLHQTEFVHAFKGRVASARVPMDVPARPIGGSEATLAKAAYRATDFRVVMGPSVRMVMDVADWDRSVWMNAPGQSGDPRSPHFADLVEPWAKGEYVPMPFSAAAVDAVVSERIVLVPPPT